jgi:hypothetical protein
LTLAASTAWVDEKAMEHVKNFFSNVMFLKHCNFKLEMKSFATKAAFTGSAHYMMNQADSKWNVKMRGVEAKKPVQAFGVDLSFLSDYEKESPAFQAMFRILENPDLVKIGTPYVKHKMLKLAEYTRRLTALKNKQVELRALEGGDFDDSNSDAQINRMMNECHTVIKRGCGLSPGESYFAVVIPRLFLAGVFNYRTQHQFEQWCKFNESLLGKYGVGIELFYSDVFGNVRYMDMLHDVDTALFNGVGCKGKKISEFFRNKTRYIKDVYNNPFYIERKKAVAQMKERCASLAFMSENDILDWWETENLEEESDILDVENDVENDDF